MRTIETVTEQFLKRLQLQFHLISLYNSSDGQIIYEDPAIKNIIRNELH